MLKRNNLYDLILGIIVLIISIFIMFDTRNIQVGILDQQIGFIASPKGFITIIGSGLMILSGMLIIQSIVRFFRPLKSEISEEKEQIDKEKVMLPKEVLISMVVFVAYVATMETFGFFINSFILLVTFMTMYYAKEKSINIKDKEKVRKIVLNMIIISVISLFVLQQIFVRLLGVSLPKGIFGF